LENASIRKLENKAVILMKKSPMKKANLTEIALFSLVKMNARAALESQIRTSQAKTVMVAGLLASQNLRSWQKLFLAWGNRLRTKPPISTTSRCSRFSRAIIPRLSYPPIPAKRSLARGLLLTKSTIIIAVQETNHLIRKRRRRE
jgi:hypothetical protein